MKAPLELDQVKKRAVRHWFEDGLSEICIGGFFVLIGAVFLLQSLAQPGSLLTALLGIGAFVLVVLGIWLVRALIRRLKERLAYARTGYVVYHSPTKLQRVLSMFLGMLTAAIFGWLIVSYARSLSAWLPLWEGLALALPSAVLGQRTGLIRFHLYALITVLVSAGVSLSGAGDLVGSGWVFTSAGLLMSLAGTCVFVSYWRNTQPGQEA